LSDITDWATAIGTCGAVIVSLIYATRDLRQRRRQEERQQAEQLTAWFVPYKEKQDDENKFYEGLRVKNASNQLIYDLIVQVVAAQGAFRRTAVGDARAVEFGAMVGNIPPGEITTRINTGGGGMHKRLWVELAFQDAAGRYWLRDGSGTLKRVSVHPVDLYKLDRPVSWEN
jgi:hypothetical protein